MQYLLLLLVPAVALKSSMHSYRSHRVTAKPMCKTGKELAGWPVGPGGKWKDVDPTKYDPLPSDKTLAFQPGCVYSQMKFFDPKECRLPHKPEEVAKKNTPKRFLFMGDSVMDNSAASFSWFMQKEDRILNQKGCKFQKVEMEKHLQASGRFDKKTINDAVHWMVQQGGNNRAHGHVWWGCKNSSVMYVPVLKLEPQNPKVIKALMYAATTFGDSPLGKDDVIVMNWGLHGLADGRKAKTNLAHMDKVWTPALKLILDEWKDWKANSTKGAPKLIWREVSPQHWSNPDGMWQKDDTKKECGAISNKNDLVKKNDSYPLRNTMMFEQAVHDAGLEVDSKDIEILYTWRASADRAEEHPTNDCTHYCQYGSTMRYWNSALLAVSSEMIQKTKALPKALGDKVAAKKSKDYS